MKIKRINLKFFKKLNIFKWFRKINKSKFIGQQFSRLKMGQTYYSIIVSTINAISLITLAFQLNLLHLIFRDCIVLL